jgi:Fe(3+) dicitrate transport protein
MAPPTIGDTIQATTLQYGNRRVDIDQYRNQGIEARILHSYTIGKATHSFSTGLRIYRGNTFRFQNGRGDTGIDFNLSTESSYPTDLDFRTINTAFFAENVFRLGKKLLLIPGFRIENIRNVADGSVSMNGGTEQKVANQNKTRRFILPGIGAEYHIGNTEIYANYSQAYRPVLFSDLTANPITDEIDQNLKDARGYNIDLGYRGRIKDYLFFDVSGFWLQYNNRVGLIAQQRIDGSFYNLRTNVGNSVSRGAEILVELSLLKALSTDKRYGNLTLFSSLAFIDARYNNLRVISRQGNSLITSNLKNKQVENAPRQILRNGITYSKTKWKATLQHSYVSSAFSDANNTSTTVATGINGLIPSYQLVDISGSFDFNASLFIRAGINNLLNEKYFTRRAGGYPGPGLMTAEPRNLFLTIGVKL